MSNPIIEKGPWTASYYGNHILSDDMTLGVELRIERGEFKSQKDRKAYAREIARRLNQWQKEHGDE